MRMLYIKKLIFSVLLPVYSFAPSGCEKTADRTDMEKFSTSEARLSECLPENVVCPVGTTPTITTEQRYLETRREGIYSVFRAGSCIFECKQIAECPEDTVPYITRQNFECVPMDEVLVPGTGFCRKYADGIALCGRLMWLQQDTGQSIEQIDTPVNEFIDQFEHDGFDDWRAPTIVELTQLYTTGDEATADCGEQVVVDSQITLGCGLIRSSEYESIFGTEFYKYFDFSDGQIKELDESGDDSSEPPRTRLLLVREIN